MPLVKVELLRPARAVLPFILVGLITGCIPGPVREKQTQLCGHLADLERAIATLEDMGNSATVRDLKQAEAHLTRAFKSVREAAGEVPKADLNALETAYEDLDQTVQDIPDQTSIAQAKAMISEKLTTVESRVTRLQSMARCPENVGFR